MKKEQSSFLIAILMGIVIGLMLFIFGWLQSDVSHIDNKVDAFIQTYVQVVGGLQTPEKGKQLGGR